MLSLMAKRFPPMSDMTVIREAGLSPMVVAACVP